MGENVTTFSTGYRARHSRGAAPRRSITGEPPHDSWGSAQTCSRGNVMSMTRLSRITVNPAVCHGSPCIRGMRYPVELIVDLLASGMTSEQVLADYADLELDDILAALEFAANVTRTRSVSPIPAA